MITKADIAAWRSATAAGLRVIGETDEATLGVYNKRGTIADNDWDLVALNKIDGAIQAAGFSALFLDQGKWWCTYGQIRLRAFVQHQGQPELRCSLVAKCFGTRQDNMEVAEWICISQHDGGDMPVPVVTQTHFDLAGLVLPQK